MISKDDLKQIVMLGYLSDDMLDLLIPIIEMLQFDAKEYIFRQGDKADRFYMLLHGKVLLEQRISSHITVAVSAIKPGYSFGWSAMVDESEYSMDALSEEPSQVLSIRAEKLTAVFEKNHSLGYIMSQRLMRIIKKRYDVRTEQFVRAIRHHPDIASLL
jgi:CRP-like cAMP-binding protein